MWEWRGSGSCVKVCLWPWPMCVVWAEGGKHCAAVRQHGATRSQHSAVHFLTHRGNTLGFVYASGASTVQKCENGREEEGDENLSSTFHDDLEVFTNFRKKRMTPQSQQMVVWSRVFLKTICNSPRLKMFCGHPLCPQDCICPHIIKLSVHREQSGIAGPIEMFWHRHHAALSPDAIAPVYLPKHNAIYLFIFLFILQNGFFFCLSLLNPPFFSPKEVPLFVADK